jgi:hypothetical protein
MLQGIDDPSLESDGEKLGERLVRPLRLAQGAFGDLNAVGAERQIRDQAYPRCFGELASVAR